MQKKFKFEIKTSQLWALALLFAAAKCVSAYFQLITASPALSPIDDTLLFEMARSISNGNWLGKYGNLTLGKHSFYSLWLAFLHVFGLNILVAAQALYGAACITFALALRPVVKNNAALLFIYTVVLFSPHSYAHYTLRVYRDQIYYSLVLLGLACLLGAFLRFNKPIAKSLPFLAGAGFAFAACWLNHEDNALLLPFIVVATVVYFIMLYVSKQKLIMRAAALLLPLAIFAVCISAWCGMNYKRYGRFIISDYTSAEFNDAMGALSRALPENQERYLLLPKETRQILYDASPAFASIKPFLDQDRVYLGYGSIEDKEIGSSGLHWAIRQAARDAGYYKDAVTAQKFWQTVAQEVNAFCESGEISAGKKASGVYSPIKAEYILPTMGKFGEQLKMFLFFEDNEPYQPLSIARPDQTKRWESYLHTKSTIIAKAYTSEPYFNPLQTIALKCFGLITFMYRILIWPLIAVALFGIFRFFSRKKTLEQVLAFILMLGFFLTGLLRMGAVAYIMAVAAPIKTFLMYTSPAYPLIIAFLMYCAMLVFEDKGGKSGNTITRY